MKSPSSLLAWGTLLTVLLLWVLTTFVAERTVPTLLLTSFGLPQFWLILTLPALVVSLRQRRPDAILASVLAVALALSMLGWQGLGWQGPVGTKMGTDEPTSFRLMTYNIARGAGGSAALAATVSAQRPDVVCFQETNTLTPGGLADLEGRLPGYAAVHSREVAILTRFPVLAQRDEPLPGTTRRLLSARLNVKGHPVTVMSVHFTTVLLRGGWEEGRQHRSDQARAVLEGARQTTGAFLACGDFNTPPRGQIYTGLKQTFTNAFEEAGNGFGYTFPSSLPLVRIDHVWLRGMHARRSWVPSSRASDHRPLVVDLALR